MTPENTPFFSGNAGLVYRPDWFKGFRINGGVSYTGERQINPQNQAAIPETYIWNMGASYATKIGDQRVNFNLNVRNITDKRYFSSAVNGALGVGAPRTITLSANVAF
jgi:iron complex outermembrane recepter protein